MSRTLFALALLVVPFCAVAQDVAINEGVDLLLAPTLESVDAPFYRGARVKMGNEVMPVIEDRLPDGVVAEYRPERNAVVVSNDSNVSENRKAQALMDVVSALGFGNVATAAGSEE